MTTARQRRNLELVRAGLQNYAVGNEEVVLESFDPDVVVYVPPEMGNAGTFHGHEGWSEWIAAWNEAWKDEVITINDLEPVGSRFTLAQVNVHGQGRGSGIEVDMNVFYLHEVDPQTDLCTFFGVFPDRAAALKAIEERDSG